MRPILIFTAVLLLVGCGSVTKASGHLARWCDGCTVNEAEDACIRAITVFDDPAKIVKTYVVISEVGKPEADPVRHWHEAKDDACKLGADALIMGGSAERLEYGGSAAPLRASVEGRRNTYDKLYAIRFVGLSPWRRE